MDFRKMNQLNSDDNPIPVVDQDPMESLNNPNFSVDPMVDREPQLSDIDVQKEIDMVSDDMGLDIPEGISENPQAPEPMISEGLNRQQILDAYRRLKPAQEKYQQDLSNIGMLQGANMIAQGFARGHGANIGAGEEGIRALQAQSKEGIDSIGRELDTAKNTMGTSKMLMDYDEAEKMNDPNSDVSKLYREQAYAALQKISPDSTLIGKLDNMSASQLLKLPGLKNVFSGGPSDKGRYQKATVTTPDGKLKLMAFDTATTEMKDLGLGAGYAPWIGQDPRTGLLTEKNRNILGAPVYHLGNASLPATNINSFSESVTQAPTTSGSPVGVDTTSNKPKLEPIKIDYNMINNVDVKTKDRLLSERDNIQKLATSTIEDSKQLSNLKEITEKGVAGDNDLIGYVNNNVARTLNGEKGTMTEGDLTRSRPRQDWFGAFDEWKENKLFNKLSQKSKDIILDAIRINKEVADKNLTSLLNIRSRPAVRDLESILGRPVDSRSVEEFMGITDALDEYRKFNKIGEKTSKSTASPGMVRMKTPDGKLIEIPKENVEKAKARGAVEVK